MFYHNIKRVKEIAAEIEKHESLLSAINLRDIDVHLESTGFNTKYIQEEDGSLLDAAIKRFRYDLREVLTTQVDKLKAELNEL
jgi:hypothetical protein